MNRKNLRVVATILALIGIVLTLLSALNTHQVFYLILCFILIVVVILLILQAVNSRKEKCSLYQIHPSHQELVFEIPHMMSFREMRLPATAINVTTTRNSRQAKKKINVMQEQQEAPDFTLPMVVDTKMLLLESIHLATLRGRVVLLTFFPRGDLIGTSPLIKDFCELYPTLEQRAIAFFAISSETPTHLHQFVIRHQIPFPLLADTQGMVAQMYGVYRPKHFFGQRYRGIVRTTILIDSVGIIHQIWSPVNPAGHTQQVVAMMERLSFFKGQQ